MTLKTKILLALSLIAFALGFTDLFWGVGKPIGAVLLGLFMIFKVLEKEAALFDADQNQLEAQAAKFGAIPAKARARGELREAVLGTRAG